MRIGIDFDNTIVSYDRLFYRVAGERALIPAGLPQSKLAVRDYLRKIGREDDWTEMQGYVYGARMAEADVYPGVTGFLRAARERGIEASIVSHKTRHPFRGPAYDLHAAARAWVEATLCDEQGPYLPADRVYFELTKDDKLSRIAALDCICFIDDLPEILRAPGFPASVERILFDPDGAHESESGLRRLSSWTDIGQHLGAYAV